ncbi:alpha-ketoglutarate-dependent dioxygenase AlkB [Pontibacter sp. BT731]|uniref:alpha-ketoglutarate-dependent dioxygenase AlkB family protein n=1 Tax=Pontibacter coccineus TaxID=3063328 RepID=UPI0026E3F358|nr:alpha-ketoglutarate-dependent dioxygenase AlkB [Pontibacter sp. BT731]MDO6390583.1 alpha-ketoglutarate-dependent dioxygenase AlkB [Pontibacter sp. BT731]
MIQKNENFTQLDIPEAEVYYAPHFFKKEESDLYLQLLTEEVAWQQEEIRMFGKQLPLPRLTAWYGDKGYTYSGLYNAPQPWLPILLELKERVEASSGDRYNSVLLNYYRHGQDSMGWHADDEKALGPGIASISFGGERDFAFRHRRRKDLPTVKLTLQHGSLLLMQGATQQHWQHQLPKTSRQIAPRINLTFRTIVG